MKNLVNVTNDKTTTIKNNVNENQIIYQIVMNEIVFKTKFFSQFLKLKFNNYMNDVVSCCKKNVPNLFTSKK